MPLKERLQRLRGGLPSVSAVSSAAEEPTPRLSLAERLRRVSVRRVAAPLDGVPRPEALAEAVGGVECAPGVLLVERHLRVPARHGRTLIGPWAAADVGALMELGWVRGGGSPMSPSLPLLCLDTETSGLAGGTGTWAFITGLLRATASGWTLRQYVLLRLDAEPAYLGAIAAELSSAGLLVSYNGRSFDVPLLTTRFRLVGSSDPFGSLPHLDLLTPVRRAYGRIWSDCRLASVEQRLLGFARTGDLPGAEAPAAWLAWLRGGESQPLMAVLRHNRWDLVSLAGLLARLGEVYLDPAAFEADIQAVAAHYAALGRSDQAIRLLVAERGRLNRAGLLDLARLYRRRGEWEAARLIWDELTQAGDARARVELAKYHEHRSGDLARALELALGLPLGPLTDRRCARLRAKLRARDGASLDLPI
jgi:hypothetical protein